MPHEVESCGVNITHETIAGYMEGIEWLKKHGFKIYGVVINGMTGLVKALSIPGSTMPISPDVDRSEIHNTRSHL